MVQKIWNDTDSVHVRLWKQLLYWGCNRAAVALLEDVFDWIVTDEQRDQLQSDLQKKLQAIVQQAIGHSPPRALSRQEKRMYADSRKHAMEDAMVMLGDKDGDKLCEWVKLYVSGDFKHHALDWVEHCHEADVFGLFCNNKNPPPAT